MNAVEPDEPMGVKHVAKAAVTRGTWELGMTIMIYVTGRALGTCTFSTELHRRVILTEYRRPKIFVHEQGQKDLLDTEFLNFRYCLNVTIFKYLSINYLNLGY